MVSMTEFFRFLAWALAAVVTFSTLGPAHYRPELRITHDGEHALAFILLGLAFALAYPRHRPLVASTAVILIGLLELLQLFAPGRHARLSDFLVDALAALIGMAIVASHNRFLNRAMFWR
jgi:VanZ family protein